VSGAYSGNNSWTFSSVQPQINYQANVDSLAPGTYEMGLNGFNSRFNIYTGPVTLPVVNSNTFVNSFDADGNLHFSWAAPQNLLNTQFLYADISGYKDGNYFSDLVIQNPYLSQKNSSA
jgi:hypothetical protein